MTPDLHSQYVCQVREYDMLGCHFDRLPFCGAPKERFPPIEEDTRGDQVRLYHGIDRISRFNSVPPRGLDHVVCALETEQRILWIDAPSSMDRFLSSRVQKILYTHPNFLGVSNLSHTYLEETTLLSETQEGRYA